MKRSRDGASAVLPSVAEAEVSTALSAVSADDVYESPAVRAYLFSLRAVLLGAGADAPLTSSAHAASFPSLPLHLWACDASGSVELSGSAAPTRVDVVGAFVLRTLVRPALTIDLAVEMPRSIFIARDVKNHAYTDKRALFLGGLARALSGSALVESVSAEASDGDAGRPVLLVRPAHGAVAELFRVVETDARGGAADGNGDGDEYDSDSAAPAVISARRARAYSRLLSSLRVRIVPTISPAVAVFSPKLLRPAWSNVRPYVITGCVPAAGAEAADAPSTPLYNGSIAGDASPRWLTAVAHEAFSTTPAARGVTVLLKTWARRRGWHRTNDHFPGSLLTALVVHCVRTGKIAASASVSQALRATLSFLATTDLAKTRIVLQAVGVGRSRRAGGGRKKRDVPGADDDTDRSGNDDDDSDADNVEEDSDSGDDEGDGGDDADDCGDDGDDISDDGDEDEEDGTADGIDSHGGRESETPSAEFDGSQPLLAVDSALLAEHEAAAPVVIMCASGLVNLARRVSTAAATEIRAHAAATLSALVAGSANIVESFLSDSLPPAILYDRVLVAPLSNCPISKLPPPLSSARVGAGAAGVRTGSDYVSSAATRNLSAAAVAALCDQPTWSAFCAHGARAVVTAALGDRVTLVRVLPVYAAPVAAGRTDADAAWSAPDPFTWPLDETAPTPTCLWVCVDLALGAASTRVVERGPTPEDAARAADFVNFWGADLSEIRRFSDGAVTHAVVWSAARLGGRAHARECIVPLIISRSLARHAAVAMPLSALYAGDALAVPADADTATVAAALLLADVARACPALALERVLDAGGVGTVLARVDFDVKVGGGDVKVGGGGGGEGGVSPLTGLPLSNAEAVTLPSLAAPHTRGRPVSVHNVRVSTETLGCDADARSTATASDALSRGRVAAIMSARAAFDAVVIALRNAPGMPLSIASAVPTSAALRYTATPPAPHPLATGSGARPPKAGEEDVADADGAGGGATASAVLASLTTARDLCALAGTAARGVDAARALGLGGGSGSPTPSPLVACQTLVPLDAVLTLETSSAWPDDVSAIRALKTAFYLKLQYGFNTVARGAARARASATHLDVFAGGYVFRFTLAVERERTILARTARRAALAADAPDLRAAPINLDADIADAESAWAAGGAGPRGAAGPRPEPATRKAHRRAVAAATGVAVGDRAMPAAELASAVRRVFAPDGTIAVCGADDVHAARASAGAALDALYVATVAAPAHAAAMHALALAAPAFGGTVVLAHEWLSTWGVGSAASFPFEAIELTVARVFCAPAPAPRAPATPAVAFLRWLRLLATWDWAGSPLVVDIASLVGTGAASGGVDAATAPVAAGDASTPSGGLSPDAARALSSRFKVSRAQKKAGVATPGGTPLYVVTPSDADATPLWSRHAPTWPTLARVVSLARDAADELTAAMSPKIPSLSAPSSPRAVGRSTPHPALLGPRLAPTLADIVAAPPTALFVHATAAALSAFDVTFAIRAPDVVPRALLDARSFGPLRPPIALAVALAQPLTTLAAAAAAVVVPTTTAAGALDPALTLAVEPMPAPRGARGAPPTLTRGARALAAAAVTIDAGVCEASRFSLPVYRNELAAARDALLVGFDPLATFCENAAGHVGGSASVFILPGGGLAAPAVGLRLLDADRARGDTLARALNVAAAVVAEGDGFVCGAAVGALA